MITSVVDPSISGPIGEAQGAQAEQAAQAELASSSPFESLGLIPQLVAAIRACGYPIPTPIQASSVPYAVAGRDVLGQAQTGTGKTGAYLWPMLQRLAKAGPKTLPRGLVLCPTRELAVQVYQSCLRYRGGLRIKPVLCVGGVPVDDQAADVRQGCDIVIGTPGRLTELVLSDDLDLQRVNCVVLDEADRMLELGFFTETRRLLRATAAGRQTMFYSATLSREIESWAGTVLSDPIRVEAAPPGTLVDSIREVSVRLKPSAKAAGISALLKHGMLGGLDEGVDRRKVLVFVNHRRAVDALAEFLGAEGMPCSVLHGGKAQSIRQASLDGFKAMERGVLIATDVAARGLEIPGVTMVVSAELPTEAIEYVHRSGRTARMGRDGLAVSMVSDEEVPLLRAIESVTSRSIPVGEIANFDPKGEYPPILTANWSEVSSAKRAKTGAKKAQASGAGKKPAGAKPAGTRSPSAKPSGAKSSSRKVGGKKASSKRPGASSGDRKPKPEGESGQRPTSRKKTARKKPTPQPKTQGAARARNQSRLARKANPSKGGKLKVVSRKRGG